MDEAEKFDEIFLCEKPDYSYDKKKINASREKKKAKKFNMDEINLNPDGK